MAKRYGRIMEYRGVRNALGALTGVSAMAGTSALAAQAAGDPVTAISAAAPHLFAAVSGAAAVALALALAAMWRRQSARGAEAAAIRARLSSDLSSEKVFVVEPGRLHPASPATEAYIRRSAAQGSTDGERQSRAAMLREIFGAETASALTPMLRNLAETGANFDWTAPDARGSVWRFVGETQGARAIVRLLPAIAPPMANVDIEAVDDPSAGLVPATEPHAEAQIHALELAPAGAALFDASARLIFANAAARRLFRLGEDWIALQPNLRTLLDHLRESGRMPERPDHADWRTKVLADPLEAFSEPRLWRLSGGESLRVSIAAAPDGGFILYVTDETGAREIDRRYKIAMGARRATIAAIDVGLAVIGVEGRLQLANPAFVGMWRLPEALLDEQSAGQETLAEIAQEAANTPEDHEIWNRILQAIASDAGRGRRVWEFTDQASRDRVLTIRISPLPDGATLIGFADVTDVQRAEHALREKAEALEAVAKLKTEVLDDVAYQLRTPLNAVIGFSDMLRQGMLGPLDRRQQEYLGYVVTAANDLHELIAETLALGELSTDTSDAAAPPDILDLRALCGSVMALLRTRADRRGVAFSFQDAEAPLSIQGDETRLRQAIFGAGTAVLSCAASGDKVVVRLGASAMDGTDGYAARFEARLERRHPLGDAPKSAGRGAGISLARRIVSVHGGKGVFEETVEGAIAVLEFPLVEKALEVGE